VIYQSLHWPEALASLENALTRFPDSSNLWLKYGDLLLDLYEFEKAERVFLTVMGNWPDSLLRMKNMPG
jgi:tetratricopeptide (TPR) repeat protein